MGFMDKTLDKAMEKLDSRFGELRVILEALVETQREMLQELRNLNGKMGPS